ncbi:uncharacterized protein EAE97_002368 [Botrytis byssoidea]|uniref:NACHT domain-containing protein n=1 Tax=Botrytis byssoidea TaxID=139641 RepID=A0A9P5IXT9_9HELO|nr:uncharacterized protein EAE97_002368 [Botrytis byssoidea]KAF7950816.1 hypothetical protein EAE97_002368 [Botrytis byssoidea]
MASSCSTPTIPQRTVAEKRWHQAWESLKKEDKDEIKLDPTRTDYLDILQDIHNLAIEKKEVCIQNAWKYKKNNGTTIIVRDLFEKILVWVNKVKDVGDVIVSYDPGHAALPWAAVRLLLTIAVEDSQSLGILIEGLEQISKLIAQCKVLEDLYSQSAGDNTGFDGALLELYVAILTFESHAIQMYRKSTASRLISAIKLPSNKLQDGLKMVWVKHQRVTDCTRLIDAQYIRQFEDILQQFEHPIVRSAAILQNYEDSLDLQERETLLRWLSTIPYRKHHKLKRSERLEGSCEWLLNSADYIQWKDSSASSILWLNGIAGCGKSVLTSAVIESLCQESSSMGTAALVAYFYCSRNTAEPERANPEEVLRSILEQVSSNTAELPIRKPVVEVYKNLKKENRGLSPQERLSLDETTEVLLKILQVDPFYVVIDALDECDPSERYSLIESLKTIIDKSASVVKIFISSRRDNDILSQFEESPCISIQPSHISKDIENYVKKEVFEAMEKKRIVKGKLLPKEKKKIEQQITQTLIDESQGMFRWVTLQMQQLCKQVRVKGDIDSVLRKLPKSLEESYHLVYQDIMSMEEPSQKVAIRTLQVLLSTRRKLILDEMLAAVTVEIDTNEVLISTVDELLDVCCNLIIFDKGEQILRFAHLSVREFLEKCAPRDHFSIQSRELFLMNRCLYIFLYESHHVVISREQAEEITRQNRRFEMYAAEYWPEHCKLAQPDVVTSEFLKKFIGNDLDTGHSASYKMWLERSNSLQNMPQIFCHIHGYHFDRGAPLLISDISCMYGLMAIIMTLLQYKHINWNAPMANQYGRVYYPLVFAAKGGHVMIVKQILSRYSGYYAKGSPGHDIFFMSLIEAIKTPQIEVAKILLDYGIVKSIIPSVESVKDLETLKDDHEIVQRQNAQGNSPLELAVLHCNTPIIDALCSFGADVLAKDSSGATLIHCLAKGFPEHMRNYYPCVKEYENTIECLIRNGVDIAAIDNSQRTALHVAACHVNDLDHLVPVIVNAGTPINAQNNEGDTALNILVTRSWLTAKVECAFLLLSLGADCSIPNNDGLTALDKAQRVLKELYPKHYQRRAYRYVVEKLTTASQGKIVEDIWRLFVDDS